jgi:D-alanyl-D-alanine carboxypeptidase/D-alanyl-D-alanine-endopeptidase (penicillin-binding protein 4)
MARRAAVGATLASVAVLAAALAAWPAARPPVTTAAGAATPVLSIRRLPAFVADTVAGTRLRQRLDAAVGTRPRTCLVVDDQRGPRLYTRDPDTPIVPASNLKLLTVTAVLERIRDSEQFRTEVRARQAPVAGVVAGDLWLVGAGDPLLALGDFAATAGYQRQPRLATPVETLAANLVAAGVRRVEGRIVGDESRYDTQRVVPTWSPTYASDFEVGPMSALTVDDNFAKWEPQHVPAPAPATNAATVLAQQLQGRGVQVGGAGEGQAPPGTTVVASVPSKPMAEVVGETLAQSDNLAAELLTKELGRRFGGAGTTAAGVGVVRDTLRSLGFPVDGLVMADGSGLDRSDRANCRVLLQSVERGGPGGALSRGLPVAGGKGTLLHRFGGTPAAGRVRAKTGSLSGVAALTGWVTAQAGRSLAFSLVTNAATSEADGQALENRVAAALVTFPEAPSVETLAPEATRR